MAQHGIKLTPEFSRYVAGNIQGFRMRVAASEGVGMDAAIFIYRELPLQPGADDREAVFDHVGSPSDLVDYPLDEPNPTADPPWFRASVIDLVLRSRHEVDELWSAIQGDVVNLVETLDLMDVLDAAMPVVVGEAGSDSSSSSGSA